VTSRIELAVSIPQTFPGRPVDPGFIRKYLERAEALGFHSAWVVEQIVGAIPSLEPVELLTYAAAVTSRIRLGPAVLLTALRDPVHTAKSLTTLDHLSGGRLMIGVGLGGQPAVYPAYGLKAERRAERFAEGLEVMKRLWTEPRVTFEGQFFKLANLPQEPKPVQKPHPPIWVGGHSRAALRRTVQFGAAWHPINRSPEELRIGREELARLSLARGRAAPPVITLRNDVRVVQAGESVPKSTHGGRVIAGEPARLVEQIAELAECGVEHLVLEFLSADGPELDKQMAVFAERVRPKLA